MTMMRDLAKLLDADLLPIACGALVALIILMGLVTCSLQSMSELDRIGCNLGVGSRILELAQRRSPAQQFSHSVKMEIASFGLLVNDASNAMEGVNNGW